MGKACSNHSNNAENAIIKKCIMFLWQYDTSLPSNTFFLPHSQNIDNFFVCLLKTNINLSLLHFRDMRVED